MSNEVLYTFKIFSVPHILFLAILIPAAVILGIVLAKKVGYSNKVVWVCFFIGVISEIEKIVFFMQKHIIMIGETAINTYRLPAEHIPFNMCPMQIFLMLILVMSLDIKKHSFLISFMYPTLVAGSAFAMFFPAVIDKGYHGLLDVATYRYFIYHALLVFLGFYLKKSKPVEFTIKSFGYAVVGISSAAIIMVWINAFFGWDPGVNFFFLVYPPVQGLPFLNLDNGWGIYALQIMGLGLLLFSLCYIKELIRDLPGLFKKKG